MNDLKAQHLDAFYGKNRILKGISLAALSGKCICLSGPNGSGKSTLLSVLAGINVPGLMYDADAVTLNARSLSSFKRKEIAHNIAYMTQNEYIAWNYTAYDIILAGCYARSGRADSPDDRNHNAVLSAAAELDLEPFLDRPIATLSGGEFQRVRIARALAQETDILLLDEPAASLDFAFRFSLFDTIRNLARRKNLAVIISIHDLNLAAVFADIIALLTPLPRSEKNGTPQLCAGIPTEILTPDILHAAYGQRFGIFTHPEYNCPNAFVHNAD